MPAQITILVYASLANGASSYLLPYMCFADAIRAAFSNWKTYMGAGETVGDDISGLPLNANNKKYVPFTSRKFQWLPADVIIAEDGSVKFLSYINNAHPERHAALYPATASLLQRTLPLFERVLSAAATPVHRAIKAPSKTWEPDYDDWLARKDPNDLIGVDIDALYKEERQLQEPKVPESFLAPPSSPPVHLRGRILQVCVCLFTVHVACDSCFQTYIDYLFIFLG
jgi:hypothetical protein